MRAAILREFSKPLTIENINQFGELKPGQVCVRVYASGICGAQLGEISGAKGEDKYLPHLLGHEGGGKVIEVGPGVKKVKPGDRVVMHWRKGSGIDAEPPIYTTENYEKVGGGWVTTFNTHSIVSENRLTPISNEIPYDLAALMGCALTTGFGLINNEAQLKLGQTIAVAGCGGVGLNIIQGALLVSPSEIIAIDINENALNLALVAGATTKMINNNPVDMEYNIDKICGGVDVFVDCTGVNNVINAGLRSVKSGGKLVLVGQTKFGNSQVFTNFRDFYNGKTIIDSQGGLTDPDKDIPRYCQMFKDNMFDYEFMIRQKFSINQVNQAIEEAKSNNGGRIFLEMK